jgi:DNA-binding IclR family transcriptional regulator
MSSKPLREELRNILNIIACLAKNNTENAVFDRAIIAEASHPPPDETRNHLDELKSLGLIEEDKKPTDANFRLYRITREGLNRLQNQDLR